MKATYSEAFIEQALVKVFSRGQRTIKEVAAELHVDFYTLKYWMKRTSVPKKKAMPTTDKRPSDWTAAEKSPLVSGLALCPCGYFVAFSRNVS